MPFSNWMLANVPLTIFFGDGEQARDRGFDGAVVAADPIAADTRSSRVSLKRTDTSPLARRIP